MAFFSPRLFPQIMQDMLANLVANTPLNDVNYGSVFVTMLEAAAQEDDEQYFQMLEIINNFSIDSTVGEDLDSRAVEYDVERRDAKESSTFVRFGDSAITKVETGVYSGLPGSPANSFTVNADSSTGFPVTGAIIIGRGTPNAETVNYSSITVFPNYARFNLASATSKDHGTDESIILSQGGNRTIISGTSVKVPASDTLLEISFATTATAVILDGESYVDAIPVVANESGTKGNVPIGSIRVFDSKPFPTAVVTNLSRVTNGLDEESDQELRDRIKNTIQSLSRGTGRSIVTGILGLVSDVDNKRVVSATLKNATVPAEVVKVFIDDGAGFIPSFAHVGFEVVVPAATGGEKFINAANYPINKAFVETQNLEPFNIADNSTLFVVVNGKTEVITFSSSDFAAPGAATSQEVLRKINSESQSFEARVSSDGSKVKIFSRSNNEEEITVTGGTANGALGFQTDTKYTTKLFLKRNNKISLLNKDGRTASIESGINAAYDFSSGVKNLALVVDGKINSVLDIWIRPYDFLIPNTVTVLELSALINERLHGIECVPSSNDSRITLISKTLRSDSSKIRVLDSFSTIFNEEVGVNVDRTFALTNGGSTTAFAVNGDYLYLGHADVPFQSAYVRLSVGGYGDSFPLFEYYRGGITNAWENLAVDDQTLGMTQSGHLVFRAPHEWTKTVVDGVSAYWVRIQRTNPAVITPPDVITVKISNGNEILGFSEDEVFGQRNDYRLNRFIGQFELENALISGDKVTLGSEETRAFVVTETAGNYSLLAGKTLTMTIDDIPQAYAFQLSDFGDNLSIQPIEVADAINKNFDGVLATAIDSGTYVHVQVNRINGGKIKVSNLDANFVLDFPTSEVVALDSHQPAMESVPGPFTFNLDDLLLLVIDGNVAANLTVPTFKDGEVVGATSNTTFTDTSYQPIFPLSDDLVGFEVVFKDGALAGERKVIQSYTPATGEIITATPFSGTPATGDKFQVMPVTAKQLASFWNNSQVTLLSNKAEVSAVDAGDRLQIASLNYGEEASIVVPGGSANAELLFQTEVYGIDAYKYFTGLAQEVQWTIDGKKDDPENYPGLRAAGVQVEVIEPVRIPITVAVVIRTNEGVTLTSITNNIKSAVTNYINNLLVGDDVVSSDLIVSIRGVSGVADVRITSLSDAGPSGNVAIADNELARITEDGILVG